MRLIQRIGLSGLLIFQTLFSQTFYKSRGLTLFNEGQYPEAVTAMEDWAENNESEKGIAYYYSGECYYNQALNARTVTEVREFLNRANGQFNAAINNLDLKLQYPGKDESALYKSGWVNFRLAETGDNTESTFRKAALSFSELATHSTDTLLAFAYYMAGESRLRLVEHTLWQIKTLTNAGAIDNVLSELNVTLTQAKADLGQVMRQSGLTSELKLAAQLRLMDAQMLKGLLYTQLPDPEVSGIPDADVTAKTAFESARYHDVFVSQNRSVRRRIAEDITYLEACRNLKLYTVTEDIRYRQQLNSSLDSLAGGGYEGEVFWMQGARDFVDGYSQESFVQLGANNRSAFARAASTLPEALFWLGWAQYFQDVNRSLDSFARFLRETDGNNLSPRIQLMRDDATYTRLLIQFDQHSAEQSHLLRLRSEIQNFEPVSERLKQQKSILEKLIRIGLGEPIWRSVLKAPSTEDKLDESFELVGHMLTRARQVTGQQRVPYLRYLDRLFDITRDRRERETKFYRGMALFLRSEIQDTPQGKRQYYQASADTLSDIGGIYAEEGQYIRARSIFASAKHESRDENRRHIYNAAKPIFITLINEAKSLRSLYYLAEIFRTEGNDLAAKNCYDVVIQKSAGKPGGGFWHANAQAGRSRCGNLGDLSALSGIELSNIDFPEKLLVIDGQPVSLERFADPEFARRQTWETAVLKLASLGFPGRSIYPSEENPVGSRITSRSLRTITTGIRERLATIYSGLFLQVIVPGEVPQDALVLLDGFTLEPEPGGIYRKRPIALNSVLDIRIENPHCYPVLRRISFLQPGDQIVRIPLIRRLAFEPTSADKLNDLSRIQFPGRLDGHVILQSSGRSIPQRSALYNDFLQNVHYRDFVYSPLHNGFFATNAKQKSLQFYNADPGISRSGSFPLYCDDSQTLPVSPEGIAVDQNGRIFVADWNTHRILVFDRDGSLLYQFGEFGDNRSAQSGQPVRLSFPTGLSIMADNEGITQDGQQYLRESLLFIGDRNGIHLVNLFGNYYSSLAIRESQNEIYSLTCQGYGDLAVLYYYDRLNQLIRAYQMKWQGD